MVANAQNLVEVYIHFIYYNIFAELHLFFAKYLGIFVSEDYRNLHSFEVWNCLYININILLTQNNLGVCFGASENYERLRGVK